ncbi:MAG: hypothetical protein IPF92_19875 [Myxococcales bacterium]|jgi:hypothetical protein|nr:hypothetical protein [Myxococcales bacterium]MBL0194409.1 hypothetical protein [Myxococcales bacterium]HQY60823.1 hypothetical protein [Polyangiaceae bacterium]
MADLASAEAAEAGGAGDATHRARAGFSTGRGIVAAGMLVALPLTIAALGTHASLARRAEAARAPAKRLVVSRLPSADLAFAGGSRHLRFLSLEEPQAAFADGPGLPDPDPAGGLVGVPRETFAGAYTREAPAKTKGREARP